MTERADHGLILGWLADYEQAAPWTPVDGDGPWFTTSTLQELIRSGRLTVYRFSVVWLRGYLDGEPVSYVKSLFGIVESERVELTP